MTEWPWVLAGYTITYTAIAGYIVALRLRRSRLHRHQGDMR